MDVTCSKDLLEIVLKLGVFIFPLMKTHESGLGWSYVFFSWERQ